MKKSAEDIKRDSNQLRGTIADDIRAGGEAFRPDNAQVLKFHGIYQQDDRDARKERVAGDRGKTIRFMVRSSIPGGHLTAAQYRAHDDLADELGNGTLRITSRQGIQFHGLLKGDLRRHIRALEAFQVSTWNACGDVVRNVMASPLPASNPARAAVDRLTAEINGGLKAKRGAYSQVWLDDEELATEQAFVEEDPLYGETYLPRKFKIGVAVPPNNDVDILTHDLGFVAILDGDRVVGYTVVAGGGMGMTFGKEDTHPSLAQPLFFVRPEQALAAARAVIEVQRDYGNRVNRKRARLKYLIEDRGLDWLRAEVEARLDFTPEDPRAFQFTRLSDPFGWQPQGDGDLFLGLWIENGRIADYERVKYKTALRAIVDMYAVNIRFTANHNVILEDIRPAWRAGIQSILVKNALPNPEALTLARRIGMACVALPSCGQALAESERVFSGVMQAIDAQLQILGIDRDPLLIRMTGCPNGCARPYNADFAFVGRSPGRYAFYAGGSHVGDRLARLERETVLLEDIPGVVTHYLREFAANRAGAESFSEYWGRTRATHQNPAAESFHSLAAGMQS